MLGNNVTEIVGVVVVNCSEILVEYYKGLSVMLMLGAVRTAESDPR